MGHDSFLTVGVDLVDHVLKFCFCGVLSEGAHDGAQLFGGDGAIAVLVEQRKRLFELGDLFLSQLVSLQKIRISSQSRCEQSSGGTKNTTLSTCVNTLHTLV